MKIIIYIILLSTILFASVLVPLSKAGGKIVEKSYPLCRITLKDLKFFTKSEAIRTLMSKAVYEGKYTDIDAIVIRGNLHNVPNAEKMLLKCLKSSACDALKMSENANKSFLHAKLLMKNPTLSLSELNHKVGKINENIMTKYFQRAGWKRIEGEIGRNGIDGLFVKKKNGVIVDVLVAESKYNKSLLQQTNHGQQMTKQWVSKKVDDLISKYPDNNDYKVIKEFINRDVYRSLLWNMKVDRDRLIVSLKKVHDKEGKIVTENLQGSEKMKIHYGQNQEILFDDPKNSFQKDVLSWYKHELR